MDQRKKEGKKGSGGGRGRGGRVTREGGGAGREGREWGGVSFLKEDLEFENFKICFILIISLFVGVCAHL